MGPLVLLPLGFLYLFLSPPPEVLLLQLSTQEHCTRLLDRGDHHGGANCILTFLKSSPIVPLRHEVLPELWAALLAAGRYTEGRTLAEETFDSPAATARAAFFRATFDLRLGHPSEAVADFYLALAAAPDDHLRARTCLELAKALLNLGRRKDAEAVAAHLRTVLPAAPELLLLDAIMSGKSRIR